MKLKENKESFWNKEGSGFEPEIVSEADDYPKYSNRRRIEEEDSFWNRKGNDHKGDYFITDQKHNGRPVYKSNSGYYLFSEDDGTWTVD